MTVQKMTSTLKLIERRGDEFRMTRTFHTIVAAAVEQETRVDSRENVSELTFRSLLSLLPDNSSD